MEEHYSVDLICHSSFNDTGFMKNPYWPIKYKEKIKKIRLDKYDRIICNDLKSIVIAGKYFSEEDFKKTVIIIHGSENKIIYEKVSIKNRIVRLPKFFSKTVRKCKKIIFVSEFLKKKYIESGIKVFTEKSNIQKSVVQYAGIDPKLVRNSFEQKKTRKFNTYCFCIKASSFKRL